MSGKSTLDGLLLAELERQRPGESVGVGMDAFHIGHRVLVRRGLTDVKGAPHTFDAVGFIHLLRRIRTETGTIYAPEFDRDIEDSLAHVVEISPAVGLVVTEGNYLLLDTPPWDGVRPLLDEAWFVHLDDDERRRRMLARPNAPSRTSSASTTAKRAAPAGTASWTGCVGCMRWRCCREIGTADSASGPGKQTGGNTDTAPRADSTTGKARAPRPPPQPSASAIRGCRSRRCATADQSG